MSDPESFQRPQLKDHFAELLTELAKSNQTATDEGIFSALALLANAAIYHESRQGSPAGSDVHSMVDQLQRAISVREIEGGDAIVTARLTGMLDIVFDAASKLPPRLNDDEYAILLRIKEAGHLPLSEVKDFVFPPSKPPEQHGEVTVFEVPAENYLVVVRRIVGSDIVEVSPRGEDALSAYMSYRLEQR